MSEFATILNEKEQFYRHFHVDEKFVSVVGANISTFKKRPPARQYSDNTCCQFCSSLSLHSAFVCVACSLYINTSLPYLKHYIHAVILSKSFFPHTIEGLPKLVCLQFLNAIDGL